MILHGINIDDSDTIYYKHLVYLICRGMKLGYGPSNAISVQHEYDVFVDLLLYVKLHIKKIYHKT